MSFGAGRCRQVPASRRLVSKRSASGYLVHIGWTVNRDRLRKLTLHTPHPWLSQRRRMPAGRRPHAPVSRCAAGFARLAATAGTASQVRCSSAPFPRHPSGSRRYASSHPDTQVPSWSTWTGREGLARTVSCADVKGVEPCPPSVRHGEQLLAAEDVPCGDCSNGNRSAVTSLAHPGPVHPQQLRSFPRAQPVRVGPALRGFHRRSGSRTGACHR
jgi:hypothetical protein